MNEIRLLKEAAQNLAFIGEVLLTKTRRYDPAVQAQLKESLEHIGKSIDALLASADHYEKKRVKGLVNNHGEEESN